MENRAGPGGSSEMHGGSETWLQARTERQAELNNKNPPSIFRQMVLQEVFFANYSMQRFERLPKLRMYNRKWALCGPFKEL